MQVSALLLVIISLGIMANEPEINILHAPSFEGAGRLIAHITFMELEKEAVILYPGKVFINLNQKTKRIYQVIKGLNNGFRKRGFNLDLSNKKRAKLLCYLSEYKTKDGFLYKFDLQKPAKIKVLVEVNEEKKWVEKRNPSRKTIKGEVMISKENAIQDSLIKAKKFYLNYISKKLAWRPWKTHFLGELDFLPLDTFLMPIPTKEGLLWQGFVLVNTSKKDVHRIQNFYKELDKKFLFLGAIFFLSGLLLWWISSVIDWNTKGYFSLRIKLISFIFWVGICFGALIML